MLRLLPLIEEILTKIQHLPFRNYSHFMQNTCIFWGPKVFGQLSDQQFDVQVWSVPQSPQNKGSRKEVRLILELIAGVELAAVSLETQDEVQGDMHVTCLDDGRGSLLYIDHITADRSSG